MALRIAHVSFSSSGGAGGVATRLAKAQQSLGHDAFVYSAVSGSLRDRPLGRPQHTALAVLDDSVVRNRQFHAPISLYRDRLGAQLPVALEGVDVVHVHWPNGWLAVDAMVSVAAHGTVVWTLHDMNPFTGACHYSLGCTGFHSNCGSCPAVKTPFRESVSRHLEEKARAIRELHHLSVVSPSSWLARQARESAVFGGHTVTVIPNPLPPLPNLDAQSDSRERLGLDAHSVVWAVVAGNLSDPVKSVDTAVEAFVESGRGQSGATLLLIGRGMDQGSLPPGVISLGHVDSSRLAEALLATDYLVVPSLAENQPLAISEAQAMGVSLWARDDTGLPEHLDIDPEGGVFRDQGGLAKIFANTPSPRPHAKRASLARRARKKFDATSIAKRYLQIYQSG